MKIFRTGLLKKIYLGGADPAESAIGKFFQILFAPFFLLFFIALICSALFFAYLSIFDPEAFDDSNPTKTCTTITSSDGNTIDSCDYLG